MDTGTWGLYYNYTWWGNAIQTASSVIGKPDFFGSQFEMLTSQQPNQVVNGNFATDSDWSKTGGWTISDGIANCSSYAGSSILRQTNAVPLNTKFYVSLEVKNYVSGALQVKFAPITQNLNVTGNGIYTIYTNGDNSQNQDIQIVSTTFIGSIDNVSVQIVRADNVEAVKCLADWIHETQILDV